MNCSFKQTYLSFIVPYKIFWQKVVAIWCAGTAFGDVLGWKKMEGGTAVSIILDHGSPRMFTSRPCRLKCEKTYKDRVAQPCQISQISWKHSACNFVKSITAFRKLRNMVLPRNRVKRNLPSLIDRSGFAGSCFDRVTRSQSSGIEVG